VRSEGSPPEDIELNDPNLPPPPSGVFTRSQFAVKCFRAPVAQLDRASAFGAEGWEFESLRAHHLHCYQCFRATNVLPMGLTCITVTCSNRTIIALDAIGPQAPIPYSGCTRFHRYQVLKLGFPLFLARDFVNNPASTVTATNVYSDASVVGPVRPRILIDCSNNHAA
jgi:hypothetical protein